MPSSPNFKDPGKYENFTRVYFNLPCKSPNEIKALEEVLILLLELISDDSWPIYGYTCSNYPDAVMFGQWRAPKSEVLQDGTEIEKGQVVTDRHAVLNIDFSFTLEDDKLKSTVAALHEKIAHIYFEYKSGQLVYWIIANRSVRLAFPEYEKQFGKLAKRFKATSPG